MVCACRWVGCRVASFTRVLWGTAVSLSIYFSVPPPVSRVSAAVCPQGKSAGLRSRSEAVAVGRGPRRRVMAPKAIPPNAGRRVVVQHRRRRPCRLSFSAAGRLE